MEKTKQITRIEIGETGVVYLTDFGGNLYRLEYTSDGGSTWDEVVVQKIRFKK